MNDDGKNQMIRACIIDMQFDVFGFSECNVHCPSVLCGQRLPERAFEWFKTLHVVVG